MGEKEALAKKRMKFVFLISRVEFGGSGIKIVGPPNPTRKLGGFFRTLVNK